MANCLVVSNKKRYLCVTLTIKHLAIMKANRFNIVKIKSPLMANGEMSNGKYSYVAKFVKVGYKVVYMVKSKIDDAILFESASKTIVSNFCRTTILK